MIYHVEFFVIRTQQSIDYTIFLLMVIHTFHRGRGGGGHKLQNITISSGVQMSFRCLTKVSVTSKLWLKLTDIKRHFRKTEHLSTT